MVRKWSEPDEMEWADVETPEPGPGEVRIRNRAAALNFFDILQIQGKYQVRPPFPFTPGAEIAGEIDAVGEGVTEWKAGDRVMAMPQVGGFAEYTVADAVKVFAMPAGMDWAQAAAMPIVYHTSYFALRDRGQLNPGEWLLVHAGASGTGTVIAYCAVMVAQTMARTTPVAQVRMNSFMPVLLPSAQPGALHDCRAR